MIITTLDSYGSLINNNFMGDVKETPNAEVRVRGGYRKCS